MPVVLSENRNELLDEVHEIVLHAAVEHEINVGRIERHFVSFTSIQRGKGTRNPRQYQKPERIDQCDDSSHADQQPPTDCRRLAVPYAFGRSEHVLGGLVMKAKAASSSAQSLLITINNFDESDEYRLIFVLQTNADAPCTYEISWHYR